MKKNLSLEALWALKKRPWIRGLIVLIVVVVMSVMSVMSVIFGCANGITEPTSQTNQSQFLTELPLEQYVMVGQTFQTVETYGEDNKPIGQLRISNIYSQEKTWWVTLDCLRINGSQFSSGKFHWNEMYDELKSGQWEQVTPMPN
jgi:hypothetical protein